MSETERIETETPGVDFGNEFEEGSEGNAPAANHSHSVAGEKEGAENTDFTGTLSIENDRVWLVSGGIRIEVLVAEEIPSEDSLLDAERRRAASVFRDYQNQMISIKGVQREEFILRARAAIRGAEKKKPSSRMPLETAEAFARIAQIIEDNRERFYQSKDVVAVRPGFRFAQGWITREPAIVVAVRRKVTPAFLEKGEMLMSSFEGFPVDVKPATPLELLAAQNGESSRKLLEIIKGAKTNGMNFRAAEPRGIKRKDSADLNVHRRLDS